MCRGERAKERKKNARKMEEKSSLKEKERMLANGRVAEREIEAQKSEGWGEEGGWRVVDMFSLCDL